MTTIRCGHCAKDAPSEEFQRIAPEKVVDDMGRPVVYAKHLICGYKTPKRAAQPAGKRSTIAA